MILEVLTHLSFDSEPGTYELTTNSGRVYTVVLPSDFRDPGQATVSQLCPEGQDCPDLELVVYSIVAEEGRKATLTVDDEASGGLKTLTTSCVEAIVRVK